MNQKKQQDNQELIRWNDMIKEILCFKFIKCDEYVGVFNGNMNYLMNNLHIMQQISWQSDLPKTMKKFENLFKSFGTLKDHHYLLMDRKAAFELFVYFDEHKLKSYFYFSDRFKKTWQNRFPSVELDKIVTETVGFYKGLFYLVDMEGIKKYLTILKKESGNDCSDYNIWMFKYLTNSTSSFDADEQTEK